jgi:hypothetical protein
MTPLISEIFELVDKAKTKQEKIDILKKYSLPALRGILRINFDPNVKMDLPEGEPPFRKEPDKPIGYQETNLIIEYKRFYIWLDPRQQLSKIRKEKLFIEMLEGLHISEAEVILLAKDQKLHKKYKTLKEGIVREAYPGLLPPKTDDEKKEEESPLT